MSGLRSSGERSAIENEWLRSMVDAVDDPVVVTDAGNDIIMQNRRAETVFRVNAGDSEGKRHAIALNNVLFTAFLSAWNLESGADRSESELTLVDPIEGTELYFEVLSYPVTHYRLGGARGVVSVLRNVTDLRRAAEQLSENVQRLQSADEEIRLERDRLESILRSVPFPLLVTDEGDEIVRTNAGGPAPLPRDAGGRPAAAGPAPGGGRRGPASADHPGQRRPPFVLPGPAGASSPGRSSAASWPCSTRTAGSPLPCGPRRRRSGTTWGPWPAW